MGNTMGAYMRYIINIAWCFHVCMCIHECRITTLTRNEANLWLWWTSCACALIYIIFIDVYRKSEYITTITNFASILSNWFYFLRKITALRPSVLNFWGRLIEFCQVLNKTTKNGFVGRGLRRTVIKILCSAHISSTAWKLPLTRPRYSC